MLHTMQQRNVLAVDPGKEQAGVALFDAGVLVQCALLAAKDTYTLARLVEAWHRKHWANRTSVDSLAVEGQQIYPGRRSNPNDLLPLAYLAGAVHARIPCLEARTVYPRDWTGGVPKEIRTPKVLRCLTREEQALIEGLHLPKSKVHNVIDAVGIGLYVCTRFHPRNAHEVIQ